jgi:hypothetical protein
MAFLSSSANATAFSPGFDQSPDRLFTAPQQLNETRTFRRTNPDCFRKKPELGSPSTRALHQGIKQQYLLLF